MNYEVFAPTAGLEQYVKCFWTLDDEAGPTPTIQRIIPDGCMEMIFHCGDPYRQFFPDRPSIIQPRSFIFGQISSYIEIAPTGRTNILAARFLPDGLAPLLPIPISQLENKAMDLAAIFGTAGSQLEQEILSSENRIERLSILSAFLLTRLHGKKHIDAVARDCVELIARTQGGINVNGISSSLKLHRRSLQRRFSVAIGLSPKQLARLTRLQAALKMLNENKFNTLTELAYENGYYDQAHFIRDFREFTGVSPGDFFADNLKLSSLFIGGG